VERGRWGGEEFAVIIYGEDADSLKSTAEKLRISIESAEFEAVGSITCSIGVSELRKGDTHETLFSRADHAMYTTKSEGRNRVCFE